MEFSTIEDIRDKYGPDGISQYELSEGVALISDDTQMTLFTATGLLLGTTRGRMRGLMAPYYTYVGHSYQTWLLTQTRTYPLPEDESIYSWLAHVPELFSRRAPGNTCLSAIATGEFGTIEQPLNQSKGCGGVMRVAPLGLYHTTDLDGAKVAALTHGHELGYIPAATLVHIIRCLALENLSVEQAVASARAATQRLFPQARHLPDLLSLLDKAAELAAADLDDATCIGHLGEGWVAEETLAIAVYCALKYPDDFDRALRAAVNHSGDSDSTGAVTGNILGAHLGLKGIPAKYQEHLELREIILEIATDLCRDCPNEEYAPLQDESWNEKYFSLTYTPVSAL